MTAMRIPSLTTGGDPLACGLAHGQRFAGEIADKTQERATSRTCSMSMVCLPSPKINGASPRSSRSIQRISTSVYLPWMSMRGPYTLKKRRLT